MQYIFEVEKVLITEGYDCRIQAFMTSILSLVPSIAILSLANGADSIYTSIVNQSLSTIAHLTTTLLGNRMGSKQLIRKEIAGYTDCRTQKRHAPGAYRQLKIILHIRGVQPEQK